MTANATLTSTLPPLLITGDDPLALNALEAHLENEGYTLVTTSSLDEAVNALKTTPFALILSDTTGLQILREASKLQPEATRILLTSEINLKEAPEFYTLAQVSQFIIDPKNHLLLIQTVKAFIEKWVGVRSSLEEGRFHYNPAQGWHKTLLQESFTSDYSNLKRVRDFVENVCNHAPHKTPTITYALQLAINEAFCNIVKHGKSPDEIILRGGINGDEIVFEIEDRGNAFDPTTVEKPSFTGDKDGGLGLFIIQQIADQISYTPKRFTNGWNRLKMTKKYVKKGVMTMEITHKIQDDILVINLDIENLDAKQATNFKEKILELIQQIGNHRVIFDLSKLQFIDSSGLGSFLSILRTLHSSNGELKLTHMSKSVRTIFELVCMDKIIEIYPTLDEAIRSFLANSSGKK